MENGFLKIAGYFVEEKALREFSVKSSSEKYTKLFRGLVKADYATSTQETV